MSWYSLCSCQFINWFIYAGNNENISDWLTNKMKLVVGDIWNKDLLNKLVSGHDAITHYVVESHNGNSIANLEPFLRTNAEGPYFSLGKQKNTTFVIIMYPLVRLMRIWLLMILLALWKILPIIPQVRIVLLRCLRFISARMDSYLWAKATISNCSNNYGSYQHVERLILC